MNPAVSFGANPPGGVATVPRQTFLRVGVFTADAEGGLSGNATSTTDDSRGETWLVTFSWKGSYTVNADGTGAFTIDTFGDLVCTDTSVPSPAPGSETCPRVCWAPSTMLS